MTRRPVEAEELIERIVTTRYKKARQNMTAAAQWVSTMLGVPVRKRESRRKGGKPYIAAGHRQVAGAHTTEGGSNQEGAFRTLDANGSAPHLLVGREIWQMRPFIAQASSLRGQGPFFANDRVSLQIEICANSQPGLWLPADDGTLGNLVTVIAWASLPESGLDIPIKRIVPQAVWPDDLSDMKGQVWATEKNSRRKFVLANNIFKTATGWAMHLEFPQNNHWDCGALNWTKLFQLAQSRLSAAQVV